MTIFVSKSMFNRSFFQPRPRNWSMYHIRNSWRSRRHRNRWRKGQDEKLEAVLWPGFHKIPIHGCCKFSPQLLRANYCIVLTLSIWTSLCGMLTQFLLTNAMLQDQSLLVACISLPTITSLWSTYHHRISLSSLILPVGTISILTSSSMDL